MVPVLHGPPRAAPVNHLKGFRGWMHADGYTGFNDLYRAGVAEVACMVHVWSKFVDVQQAQGSAIAEEALRRIAELYAFEKRARGRPPEECLHLRQQDAKPVFDELERWLGLQLTRISWKTPLAGAIRYALSRLPKLRPYLEDGRPELDKNSAERAMRGVAVGRKNWLFAGSEGGNVGVPLISTPSRSTDARNRAVLARRSEPASRARPVGLEDEIVSDQFDRRRVVHQEDAELRVDAGRRPHRQ